MNNEIEKHEQFLQVIQKEKDLIEKALPLINKLFLFSPEDIQNWNEEKKEAFLRKTMMKIANDEKLKDCFTTPEGKISIMEAVQKSCSTGLEIGGKHAYLVPQKINNKLTARYSIKASGYFAVLCGGSRPIFADLRWSKVYEKDECKIDAGTGEIFHTVSITEDRGEMKGIWVQIIKKNGQKEAIFYSMNKIKQWQSKSKNTRDDAPWKNWPDEMAEQACIRHACDKYEQARDLLMAAIYDDEKIDPESTTTEEIEKELNPDKDNDGSFI
jgi:recombinational DNA repair protein RecT